MHLEDDATKWFEVSYSSTTPTLEDHDRFAAILSDMDHRSRMDRFPHVVSFTGVAGAGKSTLIRLLSGLSLTPSDLSVCPGPIIGSAVHDNVATSSDVHLYADPSTFAAHRPILYADSEGLEGGEKVPMGARDQRRLSSVSDMSVERSSARSRVIRWVNEDDCGRREQVVSLLYPRLLYTFSDCVVFVSRNAKTFQSSALTRLLDWGANALERSINQPSLPHCILALSATDPSVDDREWDPEYTTESLLSTMQGTVNYVEQVPRFRALANQWRRRGKHVEGIADLIQLYYSSFVVIRFPTLSSYNLIARQTIKLRSIIERDCRVAFETKSLGRMHVNASEMNAYIGNVFDHFCAHINTPFNFMKFRMTRKPIPDDFGGHVLRLCNTITSGDRGVRSERLLHALKVLAGWVASCVLLDCARSRSGWVDALDAYEGLLDYAINEYESFNLLCAYVSPDGSRRCELSRAGHRTKFHQDCRGIIATGEFEEVMKDHGRLAQWWKGRLSAEFQDMCRNLSLQRERSHDTDEQAALDLHVEHLGRTFRNIEPESIYSHATCLCCLLEVPEHPLPCGHVLGDGCVRAYGRSHTSAVKLEWCPLHPEPRRWGQPFEIAYKPKGSGIRILVLEDGGIRGLAQIRMLQKIEQKLGYGMQIQSFFDLIVGAGTGGLIGVALATPERTTEDTSELLRRVCTDAFSSRPPVNKIVRAATARPLYSSGPLHESLKTAFSRNRRLFAAGRQFRPHIGVALVSTEYLEDRPTLFASYRRPDLPDQSYNFARPHDPRSELRTCKSVAMTMATPSLFAPVSHNGRQYIQKGSDDLVKIAKEERVAIWPSLGEDVLFYLRTGWCRKSVRAKPTDRQKKAKIAPGDVGRRIYLDPEFDEEVPTVDDVTDADRITQTVDAWLEKSHSYAVQDYAANVLIASSFFLHINHQSVDAKGARTFSGSIACRFGRGTKELRAIGDNLLARVTQSFQPYFLVTPDTGDGRVNKLVLTSQKLLLLSKQARLPPLEVVMRIDHPERPSLIALSLSPNDHFASDGHPISGFPQTLARSWCSVDENGVSEVGQVADGGSSSGLREKRQDLRQPSRSHSLSTTPDSIGYTSPPHEDATHTPSIWEGENEGGTLSSLLPLYHSNVESPT